MVNFEQKAKRIFTAQNYVVIFPRNRSGFANVNLPKKLKAEFSGVCLLSLAFPMLTRAEMLI